jgi:E3 Ubiquitin ligase
VTQLVADQSTRHFEHALGVDVPAYLLGEVKPGGTIGKPAKGSANKTFVISHKSEEERAKEIGSTMTMVFWVAIARFAAAVGVLVWAIKKGPV